jgi:hypothetical protein
MEQNKNIRVSRVELAQYQPVASTEKIERSGWLSFGDDNLYPTYLKELADTSPVHGAIVKGVARMIGGKGFAPLPTYNTDRLSRILPSVASDMSLYGGFYVECIKALGSDEVVKVTHLPFENCRLAVDENSNVTGIYYSKNWAQYRKKINEPVHIPLNSGDVKRFVKISFLDETTSVYYPQPSYKSCINYIELDRQISVFHVSNILNNFAPGTIVSLFNGTPDEDSKNAMKRELQGATGASNAGKMVVLFNEPDQQKPDIVTYQLNDADKQYDLLNRTATEKILVGHLITTPLLFGIKYGGDGFSSNADEMRQGLEIFMANVIEPMQRVIIDSLEEALNVSGLVIIPNNVLGATEVKPDAEVTTTEAGSDVASQALNGAQIQSLVDIIMQTAASAIPISSAKAVVAAGFPMLTPQQVDEIFAEIVPGSIPQEQVLQKAILSAIKKKVCASKMDMTEDQEVAWLNYLQDKGEVIDMELYDLVNEEVVEGEPVADEELSAVKLFKRFADPDAKSQNDAGLIKVRYRYSTALSDNSRIFCKNMVSASKAGVVYRYEDIIRMGDDGINSEFAAKGESTYSIFLFKGGANCHHFWTRQTFMRKRENGKFMPNKGLENDERISQASAEKKGFEFKDAKYWAEAATRPIDMPNNGYKNPRP